MALTIANLLEGRDRPLSIRPTERLTNAIDQMLRHDYTQLPVTTEADRLIGVISSDSILNALEAFGLATDKMTVSDAMAKARSFDPDSDVSDLLNALRDHYAAFVVDGEGRLTGIITGFDASEYFRRRSEDMMLVEDIEGGIKEHILAALRNSEGKLNSAKLADAIARVADPNRSVKGRVATALRKYFGEASPPIEVNSELLNKVVQDTCSSARVPSFDDLTFNNYIDLMLDQCIWDSYSDVFGVEATALRRLLESIRDTRNTLAHFRGDISSTNRQRLRFCAAWLDRHPPRRAVQPTANVVAAQNASDPPEVQIVPMEDEVEPGEGRYAKLAVWLQNALPTQDSASLPFNQVEEILGGALPAASREHRSWWANDSVNHPQSRQWLDVGWRVANVSLTDEVVTFSRVEEREAAYITFFSQLLSRLDHMKEFPLRSSSPSGVSWQTCARLPNVGSPLGVLVCSFARSNRLRVEFYIDAGNRVINKRVFDKLIGMRGEIEQKFGEPMAWERLDDKRASRIAIYESGSITADVLGQKALLDWATEALVRLYQTLVAFVNHGLANSDEPVLNPF